MQIDWLATHTIHNFKQRSAIWQTFSWSNSLFRLCKPKEGAAKKVSQSHQICTFLWWNKLQFPSGKKQEHSWCLNLWSTLTGLRFFLKHSTYYVSKIRTHPLTVKWDNISNYGSQREKNRTAPRQAQILAIWL